MQLHVKDGHIRVEKMKNIQQEKQEANFYCLSKMMERELDVPYLSKNEDGLFVHEDYARFAALELLIEEVKKIDGYPDAALAELGVFRGKTALCINEKFPDRKFYLFDTFTGFDSRDVAVEIAEKYTSAEFAYEGRFSNTVVENVLASMKYPEKCVLCKGYFPETIPKEDINYLLVSMDCDLYNPVYEGLMYFYPRLVQGGYIMLHDYNNNERWLGVKKALAECEKVFGHICKVPLPDRAGSLVITK